MSTLGNAAHKQANGGKIEVNEEQYLAKQSKIVEDFFQRDGTAEMVVSVHRMIEEFLFTEDLAQVTSEMRVHIVNNLRIASLVAQLGECSNIMINKSAKYPASSPQTNSAH